MPSLSRLNVIASPRNLFNIEVSRVWHQACRQTLSSVRVRTFLPSISSAISLTLSMSQSLYSAKHLYILSYVWRSGEQLDIPLSTCAKIHDNLHAPESAQLHLHWMQSHWLDCYPFLRKLHSSLQRKCSLGEEYCLDLSGIKIFDLSDNWENCLWVGGRDHWGHTVLDYLPSYYYLNPLLDSIPHTPLRPYDRRFNSNIDMLYRHLGLRVPLCLPESQTSTLYYLGPSLLADSKSPAYFFSSLHGVHSTRAKMYYACSSRNKLAVLPSKEVFLARVINGSEILHFLQRSGFFFLSAEAISLSDNPHSFYNGCSMIFSMYGSVLFNPLIYSAAPIACLFPAELFSSHPRFSQQFIPLLPLVDSRLHLIPASSVNPPPDDCGPINCSYYYHVNDIEAVVQSLTRY
jgi:hypothetical protein